jgi:outer membrane protein assembly factor BamD (BamD/ComL family)
MYDTKSGEEISAQARTDYFNYQGPYRESTLDAVSPKAPGDSTWMDAQTAISESNLGAARTLLERYLDETANEAEWEGVRARRSGAYDKLDAMTALEQGSSRRAVIAYLEARDALGSETAGRGAAGIDLIEKASADKNLKDNAEYLRAALILRQESIPEALIAFERHADTYPRSEKKESVLYMSAKLEMQQSHSFRTASCGIQGKSYTGNDLDPSSIEPRDKCRDASWAAAVSKFRSLMQTFPHGRYVDDARGWLAHLYYRGDERAKALAEYYKMLGHPTKRSVRLEAKKSLQMIGHEYDDATLDELEKLIADDPQTAMAYAYHRIYNHAVDLTTERFEPWCCYGDDPWQQRRDEETRIESAHAAGRHELGRIAAFGASMMKRYPSARVSGGFVLRVAEASLESEDYSDARALATKALAMGVKDSLRAEALWIRGSAEHRDKDLRRARATFSALISEFPNNRLTEGAHRLLAMTAEDEGDLESALEHYIALRYRYDVAYFVDVLLPTERYAKFVAGRPKIPLRNQLLYALGLRYMRDKRWSDARNTLQQVEVI